MDKTLQQALLEYLKTLEKATEKLKQQIKNQQTEQTSEDVFNSLNFEQREGARLGEYEIAQKTANPPDAWNKAFSILEENQSTISSRYHQEDYIYSYWLYGDNHDRIYRQKLKR
jgi:NCAIR mutase (PurE)-related protein